MKNYSVFLLEEDDLVREALWDVLEQEGYNVYPLKNSWESISFISKIQFQIAIIGSGSGDFKIQDLIAELKKINPLSSIIVTAFKPEVEDLLGFINQNVEAVILKPLSVSELKQSLEKARDFYQERLEKDNLRQEVDKIKEQKEKVEESLRKAAQSIALAELIKSLAHEFKNVLTTINLSVHFIKKSISSSEDKIKKHFALVNKGVEHANELTLRILGLSKERKERVNFNEMLNEVLEIVEPELKKSGIRTVKSIKEDIPDLFLDSSGIRQVFINIILNAKEVMKNGGLMGLKTYLEEEGEISYLVAEITDTGSGIPPGDLDKIFLLSYSTKEKGNGIGLYISRKIVEEMGGKIKVSSVLNQGSSFKILLPYKKEKKEIFVEKA